MMHVETGVTRALVLDVTREVMDAEESLSALARMLNTSTELTGAAPPGVLKKTAIALRATSMHTIAVAVGVLACAERLTTIARVLEADQNRTEAEVNDG